MKIFPGVLLTVILNFSCIKNEGRRNILPENKMREVMWDMIRADEYVSDVLLKDSTRNKKNESVKLYEEIFHIHKITQQQFKESLEYYSSQPNLFRPIIDSLAKRKIQTSPFQPPHPVHRDTMIKRLPGKSFSKQ